MLITKRDIEALIDNELDPESEARVLKALSYDNHLKNYYEKIMTQNQALKEWWAVGKNLN